MLLKFDIKFCKNKNYWKISLNPWTVPRNKTLLAFSPWKLGQNELESWTKHWHQFGEIVSLNCRKTLKNFRYFLDSTVSLILYQGWEFAHRFFDRFTLFCDQKSERAICSLKRAQRSCRSLSWATWTNRSHSLFSKERQKQISQVAL